MGLPLPTRLGSDMVQYTIRRFFRRLLRGCNAWFAPATVGLSQRARDHLEREKQQSEEKYAPAETRHDGGGRLFIHFGLFLCFFVYFFEISRETLFLFTALGRAILERRPPFYLKAQKVVKTFLRFFGMEFIAFIESWNR
jgi:hypothetical protein